MNPSAVSRPEFEQFLVLPLASALARSLGTGFAGHRRRIPRSSRSRRRKLAGRQESPAGALEPADVRQARCCSGSKGRRRCKGNKPAGNKARTVVRVLIAWR